MDLPKSNPDVHHMAIQTDTAQSNEPPANASFQGHDIGYTNGRVYIHCTNHDRVVCKPEAGSVAVEIIPHCHDRGTCAVATETRNYVISYAPHDKSGDFSGESDGITTPPQDENIEAVQLLSMAEADDSNQVCLISAEVGINDQCPVDFCPSESESGSTTHIWYLGTSPDKQSLNSGSNCSISGSFSSCFFKNSHAIKHIARELQETDQPGNRIVSILLDKLILYNPFKAPDWYQQKYQSTSVAKNYIEAARPYSMYIHSVRNHMWECFAKWTGWLTDSDKYQKILSDSKTYFEPRFLCFLKNDVHAFERLAEVSQTVICAERELNQYFQGKSKGIDPVLLYETLSFDNIHPMSKSEFRKQAKSEQYTHNCADGVFYFMQDFCRMIKKTEDSGKCTKKTKEYIALSAKLGILNMEPSKRKIALLNACVTYNLAAHMIEKEYQSSGLAKYDPSRRTDGRISSITDFSIFTDGELMIMQDLLLIIEHLNKAATNILRDYAKEIDGQPRALEDKSFEERVLHLCKDEGGYTSKPLKGIKATLLTILEHKPPSRPSSTTS